MMKSVNKNCTNATNKARPGSARTQSTKKKELESSNKTKSANNLKDIELPTTSTAEGSNKKKRERNRSSDKSLGQRSKGSDEDRQSGIRANHSRSTHSKGSGISRSSSGGSNQTDILPRDKDSDLYLDQFAKRAEELTQDICKTLEKQSCHEITDQPAEVNQLKEEVLKLSNLANNLAISDSQQPSQSEGGLEVQMTEDTSPLQQEKSDKSCNEVPNSSIKQEEPMSNDCLDHSQESSQDGLKDLKDGSATTSCSNRQDDKIEPLKSDLGLAKGLDSIQLLNTTEIDSKTHMKNPKRTKDQTKSSVDQPMTASISSKEFDSLNLRLDPESKLVALKASLGKDLRSSPNLFDLICRKLVSLSDENAALASDYERYRTENQKLNLVKIKLENLCRELQKSNNSIRIESLDLIKSEQNKAKEQTVKIQSTLSGVIKLFHENQQRNMSLKQENQELQNKLRALLEHCDNWSKGVDAALRKRDIENRLLKTELAKTNLMRNEEREKFLSEKQELLQILSLMQEQQHKIEGQEAKLRSDLSSYASKYDECKAVISKGMNKFQTESKLMMKQIEKSRNDYKALLSKYEGSNKRLSQLLVEKQTWDKQLKTANKKIETLEKLCRALRERNAKPSDKAEETIVDESIVTDEDDTSSKQPPETQNELKTSENVA